MTIERWEIIKTNLLQLDEEYGQDAPDHSLTCAESMQQLLNEIEASLYLFYS